MTDFSMQNFIANIRNDGGRVGKSYLYEVTFTFNSLDPQIKAVSPVDLEMARKLTFFCSTVNIPGYRSDTQRASIYGLPYEVVTKLEQDPLWISFYADILHKIPNLFFSGLRNDIQGFSTYGHNTTKSADNSPFTPRYKNEYQFDVELNILDENHLPVSKYNFTKCFIKTVQQISLSSSNNSVPEVTVEIIYERVISELLDAHSRAPAQVDTGNIPLGPTVDVINKIQTGFEPNPSPRDLSSPNLNKHSRLLK